MEVDRMSSSKLAVGAAKVDITPPLSIPYLGFHPRQAKFEGVHDPLYARAAVFEGPQGQAALLSADALGLSRDLFGEGRDFIDEVRQRAADGTGLDPAAIVLAATHSHSTPETYGITRIWEREDCAAWLQVLADQLAGALAMAWRDRRPAILSLGGARVSGMSGNRRMRDHQGRLFSMGRKPQDAEIVDPGCLDEQVAVLLAQREGAAPVLIANFACHPVTVQVQELISADFPGVATRLVEQALGDGACCLFVQGASGDINPIRDATRDWRDVDTYGVMLAGGILHGIGQARLAQPLDAPLIGSGSRRLSVAAREAPTMQEATARKQEVDRTLADTPSDSPDYAQALGQARQVWEMYRLVQFGAEPIEAEIQALRLGDLGIAAFPGELFCELGMRLKSASPAPQTMVAECSNGCLGYLVPEKGWDDGGYEVGLGAWCRVAKGEPEKMVAAAQELLQGLFEG